MTLPPRRPMCVGIRPGPSSEEVSGAAVNYGMG